MSEQRNVMLAGLEPKVLQTADQGLAQLVVNEQTGALKVEGDLQVSLGASALPANRHTVICNGTPSQTLLPANPSRKGFSVQVVDADRTAQITAGQGTVVIPAYGLYENHPSMNYLGEITVAAESGVVVVAFELV